VTVASTHSAFLREASWRTLANAIISWALSICS
jgi:hypothetical protein